MGDRAIIVLTDNTGDISSCGVYLHWNGQEAPEFVRKAIPRMRRGDVDYSMARLIGELDRAVPGNTSLGVVPPPKKEDFENRANGGLKKYSQGDRGIVVFNIDSGEMNVYAGYIQQNEIFPLTCEVPPG